MYLCYIDESGTSAIPGNTSHFILAGISIPVWHWRDSDTSIRAIKDRYDLKGKEIHVAWILRKYFEQSLIPMFEDMGYDQRIYEVQKYRNSELLRLQRNGKNKQYKQTRKNYLKTESYIHLTHEQRLSFIEEIAHEVSGWGYARIFAECIDKIYFDPGRSPQTVDEQSFEQVISRFEQYLENTKTSKQQKNYGLIIHDNNQTVAKKHTDLMKKFHQSGTFWTNINNIIETPLFVDSELTSMVQISDLCSYSIRRYLENNEDVLFNAIFKRADRINKKVVGIRHFTDRSCSCTICESHK